MYQRGMIVAALTLSAFSLFAVRDVVAVTEGTVKEVDTGAKKVVITATGGAERTFVVADRTMIHGFETTAHGSEKALRNLREGSEVAGHYAIEGAVDTAEEIDHIGARGLRVEVGTLRASDRVAKTITIATTDGAEKSFHLLDRAARDAGKDFVDGTEKSAKVTLYYSEDGGKKVVHFFKSSS